MGLKVDLTPVVVDLVFYAGDDGSFKLVFLDSDRAVIDLSAYDLTAQIRRSRGSSDFINLDLDMTDAVTGVVTVVVPPDTTRALANDAWDKTSQWDLQCTSPLTVTLIQGTIVCVQDVTR